MLKIALFEDEDVAKYCAGEMLWLGLNVLALLKEKDVYKLYYDDEENDAQEA